MAEFFVVAASYLFYGWWDWRFLILIFITTICSFISGILIDSCNKYKKLILWSNVLLNLGILAFFKYFKFFAENLEAILNSLGFTMDSVTMNLILHVGISFYTFQALSYSIDVYRNKIEATKNLFAFFAFISFFSQLVAGPIERSTNLLPQFLKSRKFDYYSAVDGCRQILWGLFKKIVVADNCAPVVNTIFENYKLFFFFWGGGGELWTGAILFAFQIYGDFSGYSDIAIGTAKLFGINLMRNSNFEILRIIAMLMIVIGHLYKFWYESNSPESAQNLEGIFYPWFITNQGVDVFILISGFFGINSTAKKYFNLWITVVYYSLISALFCVIFIQTPISKLIIWPLRDMLIVPSSFWFISCYFALMIFSPFINTLFRKSKYIQFVYLCIFCYADFIFQTLTDSFYGLFVWGGGLLHFVTLYIVGRIINLWNIHFKLSLSIIAYVISITIGYVSQGMPFYSSYDTSIWIVFPSVCLILIFRTLKPFYSNNINSLAKASLGVYCFHARAHSLVSFITIPILFHTFEKFGNEATIFIVMALAISIYIITIPFDLLRQRYSFILNDILYKSYMHVKSKIQTVISK